MALPRLSSALFATFSKIPAKYTQSGVHYLDIAQKLAVLACAILVRRTAILQLRWGKNDSRL
jgi:hypothetical protein